MNRHLLILLSIPALLCACNLDNYDPPRSVLSGQVTFNDKAIGLSNGGVKFNLYQDGFEKNGPIPLPVNQDGTFSALVFDGVYHIVNVEDAGPWSNDMNPVDVVVKGNTEVSVEVVPYFSISDAVIALDGTDVKALCNISQVSPGMSARQLFLVVGTTRFLCDQSYSYTARKSILSPKIGGNNFTLDISEFASKSPVLYARIGLQMDGIQECIYSETVRIK